MPMAERNNVANWFHKNSADQVLVATTGAAKEGLTLTVLGDFEPMVAPYLQLENSSILAN